LQFSSADSFTVIKQEANATQMGRHPMPSKYAKGFISHIKGKIVPVLNQ
jgi:hypothetical protein